MTISRFTSKKAMTDAQCRTLASAAADPIVESLAGRARYLWELATGTNPIADSGGTPLNPQGLLGIDRSGAPWGDALMHPLLVADHDDSDPNVYNGRDLFGKYITITTRAIQIDLELYCRPYAVYDKAPYSRGYFYGFLRRDAGTATVTAKIIKDGRDVSSQSITVDSADGNHNIVQMFCPLSVGHNKFKLQLSAVHSGSSQVDLIAFSFNQITRREHS
jgi:hypothetical protein